jgi:integrase
MPRRTHDGIKKRCDCRRKNWAKCPHGWYFNFHHQDKAYRVSLDAVARARHVPPPLTKHEAVLWRDRLRTEIRGGTFVDPSLAPSPSEPSTGALTFGDVAAQYRTRHIEVPTRRAGARLAMIRLVALACRALLPGPHGTTVPLGDKPMTAVVKADLEAVRAWRRAEQAAGHVPVGLKGGEAGTNRLLSRLRHVFSWAVAEGYLTETPFRRGPVAVLKLDARAEAPRTRRLDAADHAVMQHADPHLRAVLVAALTTGCRIGELLSLQWAQVRYDEHDAPRWLDLPATKTKQHEAHALPIGPRLRAELAMRRHAPDGTLHAPDRYVFGNEVGERVATVRRQWEDAVLCAHGHPPTRIRGKLSPESRAAYQAINLHVHDLRREFACTLLESGAAVHDVQAFLGHANITTTSRYLRSTPVRLEQALTRLEQQHETQLETRLKNRHPKRHENRQFFAHDLHNTGSSRRAQGVKPA